MSNLFGIVSFQSVLEVVCDTDVEFARIESALEDVNVVEVQWLAEA